MNRLTIKHFLEVAKKFRDKPLRIYRDQRALYLQAKDEGGYKTVAELSSEPSLYDALDSERLYKCWLKSFFF